MDRPEEALNLPEMERQTSPFVCPPMQRQTSPVPVKGLPAADIDPCPDNFFSQRGVDLPSHLSTERRRWVTLLVVVITSAFASGPIASWPTLEPILISEGVWAGPGQEVKLTAVYSIAAGVAMISQTFAGIVYDAVGPRATAAWSAFGIVACLVGMAIGIQFQSLNYLIWFCYPAATALGGCNSMGGYAFLYLLPDSQNTVASLTGAIQVLSESFVLIAVLLHHFFGLPLPFYFGLCAFLSLLAGIVCLQLIPEHAVIQKVAFVATNPDADLEGNTYGATNSSIKPEVESLWDVVKRSLVAFRDCIICFIWCCPGSTLLYLIAYGCAAYMFGTYPMFIMYPFYQAFMGTANAVTLVDIFGGLYPCFGAISLVLFGRFVDYVGFAESIALLNIPIILNLVCFCIPSFVPQIIGQLLLAFQANAWWVLVPRWCLSYVPPELYGSAFGISSGILGLFQIVGTPFGTIASTFIDTLVTESPPPYLAHLTTMAMWCFFTVLFALLYFLLVRYYPMPAPGETTMADVMSYARAAKKEDMETKYFAKNMFNESAHVASKQSVQKKNSGLACVPCNCLRPQLGSTNS